MSNCSQTCQEKIQLILFFNIFPETSAHKSNSGCQCLELTAMLPGFIISPQNLWMPVSNKPGISHFGPKALSCSCAFGTGRASAPSEKGCILFHQGLGLTVHPGCSAVPDTANPTKPFSIPACYLLLPDFAVGHSSSSHRWSHLGDSKTTSCPCPGSSYQSGRTVKQFPRLFGLLPRHLGVPSLCPWLYLISGNLQHAHF